MCHLLIFFLPCPLFVSQWTLLCQKQRRRFSFASLMEIKCHGNNLASNCVLICHNVNSTKPFLMVRSGPRRWFSMQSHPNLHVFPLTADGSEITHAPASPSPLFPFSRGFFFFLCLHLRSGAADWWQHDGLTMHSGKSQKHGHKFRAIQLYNG